MKVTLGRRPMDAAGMAHAFGMLGGVASVNFQTHALNAVIFAPADATRPDIVEAIGRGIGRSAVHELAHMISSQYYGELRWASAWAILDRRIGR